MTFDGRFALYTYNVTLCTFNGLKTFAEINIYGHGCGLYQRPPLAPTVSTHCTRYTRTLYATNGLKPKRLFEVVFSSSTSIDRVAVFYFNLVRFGRSNFVVSRVHCTYCIYVCTCPIIIYIIRSIRYRHMYRRAVVSTFFFGFYSVYKNETLQSNVSDIYTYMYRSTMKIYWTGASRITTSVERKKRK